MPNFQNGRHAGIECRTRKFFSKGASSSQYQSFGAILSSLRCSVTEITWLTNYIVYTYSTYIPNFQNGRHAGTECRTRNFFSKGASSSQYLSFGTILSFLRCSVTEITWLTPYMVSTYSTYIHTHCRIFKMAATREQNVAREIFFQKVHPHPNTYHLALF